MDDKIAVRRVVVALVVVVVVVVVIVLEECVIGVTLLFVVDDCKLSTVTTASRSNKIQAWNSGRALIAVIIDGQRRSG
jgi:hypothetical protein